MADEYLNCTDTTTPEHRSYTAENLVVHDRSAYVFFHQNSFDQQSTTKLYATQHK